MQEAAATGLEEARERRFFETQVDEYAERRNILVEAFDKLGLKYSLPDGAYFILLVSSLYLIPTVAHQHKGYIPSKVPRKLPISAQRPR